MPDSIEYSVISDHWTQLIGERRVTHAIFTTFNFEPAFFDLEVVPLLLPGSSGFSPDDRIKLMQVREQLREANIVIDVFYDPHPFGGSEETPQLEYTHVSVDLDSRAFHPKLVFLLLEKDGEASLVVGAGSNNLSKMGWWDNIECLHTVEFRLGETILGHLHSNIGSALGYLANKRTGSASDAQSAVQAIQAFWASQAINEAMMLGKDYGPSFFFNAPDLMDGSAKSFPAFIQSVIDEAQLDEIEIVSPFFADNPANKLHTLFRSEPMPGIALFLPRDHESKALCTPEYHAIRSEDTQTSWCRWSKDQKSVLVGDQQYRRLHAKLFHFISKEQSWLFAGSVNFTNNAFFNNAEAGFLLPSVGKRLLQADQDEDVVCIPPEESSPGHEAEVRRSAPSMSIAFHWDTRTLKGRADNPVTVTLFDTDNQAVIENWQLAPETQEIEGKAVRKLSGLLQRVSMVHFEATDEHGESYDAGRVLVQQVGWTHKPMDLASLTPQQILSIYAGLSRERRETMLVNSLMKKLALAGQLGELTRSESDEDDQGFFSEYAQIFQAFRKLGQSLHNEITVENWRQVDYFLTGTGPDSLPNLINGALKLANTPVEEGTLEQASLSQVSAYLLLLSAKETYQKSEFNSRPGVVEQLERVAKELQRATDRIELEGSTDRGAFFRWFEKEFFREYRLVEPEDVTDVA
jgi:hypothetical protein